MLFMINRTFISNKSGFTIVKVEETDEAGIVKVWYEVKDRGKKINRKFHSENEADNFVETELNQGPSSY